ncbi:P2 phage tail completion protein R (GpR) [Achromobacter sp. 2789STDY5608615]|uniref:phage tail protein n=1 Tax=Achromobacter sp. 2789STDY5608615 TaxID=1806492 RepID=UPI0006C4B096|nr:phage tail protein [Achromobacter sp. 2789STDY5608615]CUK22181.1 P2 phage tail completion protein R (GpR) [Achromobacter sp. 2789STDY5608615]
MRKANELREYLTRCNRYLAENPDRLHIFVDDGSIHCTASLNLSHEYRYTITIVVTDYAGVADALMLPLLAWLRIKQPELMANPERRANAIQFDVELLNHNAADVEIKLPLTERVVVRQLPDGSMVAEHVDEPVDPELPEAAPDVTIAIPGVEPDTVTVPDWRQTHG